jgi:hypothetical protein
MKPMSSLDLTGFSFAELLELNDSNVISDSELAVELAMRGLRPQIVRANKRNALATGADLGNGGEI